METNQRWRLYLPVAARNLLRTLLLVVFRLCIGHVRSWGAGHPEVLTECEGGEHGPMDPSKNDTFQFLSGLFSEVMDLFPDKTIHLGGDECSFRCWWDKFTLFRRLNVRNGLPDNRHILLTSWQAMYIIHWLMYNVNAYEHIWRDQSYSISLDSRSELLRSHIYKIPSARNEYWLTMYNPLIYKIEYHNAL